MSATQTRIVIAALIALSGCSVQTAPGASSGAPPAADTASGVPPLAASLYRLAPIERLGLTGRETPLRIGYRLQIDHGADEPARGAYSELVNVVEEDGIATIVFSMDGIPDDSLRTEQHVVEARVRSDGSATALQYGVRYRCWRGRSAGAWTNRPCA